jgi:imidazolonepropionase-like amidohydrolase
MLILACALAASIWSGAPQARALPARQLLAITDVTVIDVERERSIGPRTVLVDAGRIVAIDAPRAADIPANAQRIDGRGRFLIPGLVDMHVHLFNNASRRPPNEWAFPLFVANGVIGVREMAAEPAQIATVNRWRKEVIDGVLVAPRILAAGVPIHGGSPEDASSQVDAAANAGADFIKIFSNIPVSHWRAILTAALPRSLPVVGHAPSRVSLVAAAAAGQNDNEHLMQAFEACSRIEAEVLAQRHPLEGDALSARVDAQELNVLQAFDRPACRQAASHSPPPVRCRARPWSSK